MSFPLVSIVIPTYNQPEYIIRAVESALMQDYQNLEVIVSDDSLNDATEILLSSFIASYKIKYFHNIPHLGRQENYRKCLYQFAQGEWVLNLDGDDYLTEKQFISIAIEEIKSKKNIVFIQAGGIVLHEDGTEIERRMPKCVGISRIVSGKRYLMEFALKRRFLHLTTLYNAKIAKNIEFYRFSQLSTDLESFMRLVLYGDVILLNMNAGVWFQHQNNSSTSAKSVEIIENTKWIDSVAKYSIDHKKLNPILALSWKYLVKQQELTGLFIKKIKLENNPQQQRRIIQFVFRNYPATFIFPVFVKKLLFFYVFKK